MILLYDHYPSRYFYTKSEHFVHIVRGVVKLVKGSAFAEEPWLGVISLRTIWPSAK